MGVGAFSIKPSDMKYVDDFLKDTKLDLFVVRDFMDVFNDDCGIDGSTCYIVELDTNKQAQTSRGKVVNWEDAFEEFDEHECDLEYKHNVGGYFKKISDNKAQIAFYHCEEPEE